MITGAFAKTNLVSGSELEGMFSAFEVSCVPDCLPALPLLGFLLVAFAFLVCSRFFGTCSLPYCVPADLGGCSSLRPRWTWTSRLLCA